MSASNALENAILLLIFNNTDAANIGDAAGILGSTVAGSLYLSLHTADPGEGGSQTTSEVGYASYAREPVARSAAGWTVTANQVVNAAQVAWETATVGAGALATHWGIGTDLAGAGILLFKGQLSAPLSISNGIAPTAAAGALIVNAD